MDVPIHHHGAYLIASIQSVLQDSELLKLCDTLAAHLCRFRCRGVVVDVTVLDLLDSFAVRALGNLASVARLRGAQLVIAGIQPEVAVALARLGLNLDGVATALDLEEGLSYLDRRARA